MNGHAIAPVQYHNMQFYSKQKKLKKNSRANEEPLKIDLKVQNTLADLRYNKQIELYKKILEEQVNPILDRSRFSSYKAKIIKQEGNSSVTK